MSRPALNPLSYGGSSLVRLCSGKLYSLCRKAPFLVHRLIYFGMSGNKKTSIGDEKEALFNPFVRSMHNDKMSAIHS